MKERLFRLAQRLFWWKSPTEALANHDRFLAQVMTYGTWEDISDARAHFDEGAFRHALQHAPPGVFDVKSWIYWHHALNLLPVPPRPRRNLPDAI